MQFPRNEILGYETQPPAPPLLYERGIRSGQLWFLLFWLSIISTVFTLGLAFPTIIVVFAFAVRACRLTTGRSIYAWITVTLCGFIFLWVAICAAFFALEWLMGRA